MPNNSGSLALKLGAIALVVVATAFAMLHFLRPAAQVVPVTTGVAVNAVPGTVLVTAQRQAEIKSEIGGRILRSELEPGRSFGEGEFMAQIDTRDLDLEIERTQNEYDTLQNRLKVGSQIALDLANARDELANKERSFKLGTEAEAAVTRQQRLVNQIQQRLDLEKVDNEGRTKELANTLAQKKRLREKMTITAPFAGVVDRVFAHKNDLIGGNTPIAAFISTGRYVEAKISEENFAGVRVGQKAIVRFLSYAGKGRDQFEASVVKILPTADPETQRYVVHLEVQIAPELLVPGLTGEVSIVLGERKEATLVPRLALRGSQLFVVRDGRVESRTVKLGYTSLTDVEVLAGVKPGETVIVDELDRFHDGQRVRPLAGRL